MKRYRDLLDFDDDFWTEFWALVCTAIIGIVVYWICR